MHFMHNRWSDMALKGSQKLLAIKSGEMSVIFPVDQMARLDFMRSLKKRLICEV